MNDREGTDRYRQAERKRLTAAVAWTMEAPRERRVVKTGRRGGREAVIESREVRAE
jgi:hypothetical protein